ncbi:hypothetical protein IJ707_01555 [bacterium]|nr:hypothetical protein [bacterium]
MNFIKLIIVFILCIFSITFADTFDYGYTKDDFKYVKHKHNESSYQHAYCSAHNGTEEYQNPDFTRVDCLTDEFAIEFDFANKWAESIGQALHYQIMTGKRAKVVLILEYPEKQMVYFYRVQKIGKRYDFDVEYITPDILNLKNNKCPYKDCKCNKDN